jgi:hypothetical protein
MRDEMSGAVQPIAAVGTAHTAFVGDFAHGPVGQPERSRAPRSSSERSATNDNLIMLVGIAPLRPAELVVLRLQQRAFRP